MIKERLEALQVQAAIIQAKNAAKGFWDKPRNIGELFMLVITELSEALEAHRKGRFVQVAGRRDGDLAWVNEAPEPFLPWFTGNVKDSFEDELADAYIRLLDLTGGLGLVLSNGHELDYKNVEMDNVGDRLINITQDVLLAKAKARSVGGSKDGRHVYTALCKIEHLAKDFSIDLAKHVDWKLYYNANRPRLHGKKY